MFNEAMKKALMNKKGDLEKKLMISISMGDEGEEMEKDDMPEKEGMLSKAPEVEDVEDGQEAFEASLQEPKEDMELGDSDEMEKLQAMMGKDYMSPPKGKSLSLGEMAKEKMKAKLDMLKMKKQA